MDWCDWPIFSHYPQTQFKDKKKNTTKYKSVIYFKKGSEFFN